MTPAETLAMAQQLLERPDAKTAGLWPRAAALLARQALEQSLDERWRGKGLALDQLSTHAQLICLASYLDDPIASTLRQAWGALSSACHHHPYELAPTLEELRHLIAVTRTFLQVPA
jgi:hypothetical protein